MKVLIINPGGLPVPDVHGGAVQSLVTEIIKKNEVEKQIELVSMSPYDIDAFDESKKYKQTAFTFFSVPKWILFLDRVIYAFFSLFSKHPQSYGRILKSFYYIIYLKRHLLCNDYDYIVFEHNHLLLLSLSNKKVYKKYKDKYCIHVHNRVRTIRPVKKYFKNCKHIIAISNYLKNEIVKDTTLNVHPDQVSILYNCIDINSFYKKEVTDLSVIDKRIDRNRKIILFTGRIDPEKGVSELIDAYMKMDASKYQLVIIGGVFYSNNKKTTFAQKLYDRVKDAVERNDIVFLGYVDREKLVDYYNIAAFVVLPSIWEEPAGLTMLEASFCNCVLITTNRGGICEYVGEYARVIDVTNVEDNIVSAIHIIEQNGVICDNESILKKFNANQYYYNYCKLLSDFVR